MTGINKDFNDEAKARLHRLLGRLSAVPEGRDIADFLMRNNIEIFFDSSRTDYAATFITIDSIKNSKYTYKDCAICLNEKLNDDNLLQALVHEAQHMRQNFGECGNPDFWPSEEDHCLIRRFQEADAQAVTTQIVYMLKLKGDEGPYQELLKTDYAAMAEAFDAAYMANPCSLYDGHATRAAFDAWFKNDYSMRYYDRYTVTTQTPFLKSRIWDNPDHGLMAAPLNESWLRRFGILSAVNYLALPACAALTAAQYRRNIGENITLTFTPAPAACAL